MIKNFTKDRGEGYLNILQLAWLFFISEIHEYLSIFGAYDIQYRVYNIRRVWWIGFFTLFFILISCTFLLVSLVYLVTTLGVI
jgi:hypothetical protein